MSLYSIFSSPSNQYISYKYSSTVDRHIYFAVDMLGTHKDFEHFGKVSNPFC